MKRNTIGWLVCGWLLLGSVVLAQAPTDVQIEAPPKMVGEGEPLAIPENPVRYFDFWLGGWDVINLKPTDGKWGDVGHAKATISPVAGGDVVLEKWVGSVEGKNLRGSSLRAYNTDTKQWDIILNWHGGHPSGFFGMIGEKAGARIDQFPPGDGARQLRYGFSAMHTNSGQWDEARSKDGENWQTTWVMQFRRTAEPFALNGLNAPIERALEYTKPYTTTQQLADLIGVWQGVSVDGAAVHARMTANIDGFGLLAFVTHSVEAAEGPKRTESMTALSYSTRTRRWEGVHSSSAQSGVHPLVGKIEGAEGWPRTATFEDKQGLLHKWECADADHCTLTQRLRSDPAAATQTVKLTRAASELPLLGIFKERAPLANVLTAGQPTVEQLQAAARSGYKTIINMRASGERGEIVDEQQLVESLGMTYVHLPIAGGQGLNSENLDKFTSALEANGDAPVMVHCASSNRVGAFFALHARKIEGAAVEDAMKLGRAAGLTSLEPKVLEMLSATEDEASPESAGR